MFVMKSKFESMERLATLWKIKYELEAYAHTVTKKLSNSHSQPKQVSTQFDNEELNTLIRLCHPDRHNSSPAANKMTAKLLSLRNK